MQEILYMNVNILEDQTIFDKGLSMVSEDRKKKIKKLKNPAAARLSLGAGILLQLAMEKAGLGDYKEKIAYGKHGKPYFPKIDFHFSLSHSGEYAVCVYTNYPVGADLQKIKDSIPKHIDKILSEGEKNFWEQASEEEKGVVFYRIWARKESLIKWDGRGLRISLNEINVLHESGFTEQTTFENQILFFQDFDFLMPNYAFTVCSKILHDTDNITEIDLNFLTKY